MLNSLDSSFRILAKGELSGAAQFAALQRHFASVPAEYLEIAAEATEIELQHAGGQYVRIWGPEGCIEMDDGYGIRRRIAGAFPIGDDGGGRVIFYQDGKRGTGLYLVSYGNLDGEDAAFIATSLRDLLTKAVGIAAF